MQALNSTQTINCSISSASSSNSNSSTDDTHEHNNGIIMEQSSGASSSAVSETGMLTDQPQHCYSMDSCNSIATSTTSITSSSCQPQQNNNNNTIAINNNNCDTIKNNNQPSQMTLAKPTPLEIVNDVESVPAAVTLIDQQNALLRGVNIGMYEIMSRVLTEWE